MPTGLRPITKALRIVEATELVVDENGDSMKFYALPFKDRCELIRILKTADASTGKPDSARKRHRPAKQSVSRSVRLTKRATKGGR